MPRVEFTPRALAQLDRMIELYELPGNTRQRVAGCARLLEDFPDAGVVLPGGWDEFRFILGPWQWMLLVHARADDGTVAVVSVEDSRSATSVINRER